MGGLIIVNPQGTATLENHAAEPFSMGLELDTDLRAEFLSYGMLDGSMNAIIDAATGRKHTIGKLPQESGASNIESFRMTVVGPDGTHYVRPFTYGRSPTVLEQAFSWLKNLGYEDNVIRTPMRGMTERFENDTLQGLWGLLRKHENGLREQRVGFEPRRRDRPTIIAPNYFIIPGKVDGEQIIIHPRKYGDQLPSRGS